MKKWVKLYYNWIEVIEELEKEEIINFLHNLERFNNDEEVILNTSGERIIWNLIKPPLESAKESWDKKVEKNKENGKYGVLGAEYGKQGGRGNKKETKDEKTPLMGVKNPQNKTKTPEEKKNRIIEEENNRIIEEKKNEEKNGNEKLIEGKHMDTEIDAIQLKYKSIFQFDNIIYQNLNTNNIGKNIIEDKGIEDYMNKIKQNLDSPNSNTFNNLTTIKDEIAVVISDSLDSNYFENLVDKKYELLPQHFITENNIKLSQLNSNLFNFLLENESKLKEMNMSSIDIKKKNFENDFVKKNEEKETKNRNKKKEHTNTTKILDLKSKKEIIQYPTSGTVNEEEFNHFKQLIEENRKLEIKEREEDLLLILKSFQEYFKKVFGNEIWRLIKENKTIQIQ